MSRTDIFFSKSQPTSKFNFLQKFPLSFFYFYPASNLESSSLLLSLLLRLICTTYSNHNTKHHTTTPHTHCILASTAHHPPTGPQKKKLDYQQSLPMPQLFCSSLLLIIKLCHTWPQVISSASSQQKSKCENFQWRTWQHGFYPWPCPLDHLDLQEQNFHQSWVEWQEVWTCQSGGLHLSAIGRHRQHHSCKGLRVGHKYPKTELWEIRKYGLQSCQDDREVLRVC